MKKLKLSIFVFFLISYMFALTSCADKSADISILSDTDVFYQSSALNNKLDILWMVDSSGSMQEEQDNLADNFSAFISDFVNKGYEYNIAVSATDAWMYEYGPSTWKGQRNVRFRDGNVYDDAQSPPVLSNNSGVHMINNFTTDVISTFMTNVKVGVIGSGDERAFDSIRETLTASLNDSYNFRRDDAFLAVIIISDEEDFSRNNANINGCTGDPLPVDCREENLRPISDYTTFLDNYTNSTSTDRKYSVNAIGIFDQACADANPSSGGHMGLRYADLVTQTNGVLGSICDSNFSDSLDEIQSRISELSTQFRLSRTPIVSSIVVVINDVTIAQDTVNGWTYNSVNNSIMFHGSAIPPQGAAVQITFDPTTLE